MTSLKSAHVILRNTNDDITITDLPALEKLTIEVKYVRGGRNSLVKISRVPKLTQVFVLGAGADIDDAPSLETLIVVANGGILPQLNVHDELPRLTSLNLQGVTVSAESEGRLPTR